MHLKDAYHSLHPARPPLPRNETSFSPTARGWPAPSLVLRQGAKKCLAGLTKAISSDDRVAMASLLAEADRNGYAGQSVDEARAIVQRSELEAELQTGMR